MNTAALEQVTAGSPDAEGPSTVLDPHLGAIILPLDALRESPNNPRRHFDLAQLAELKASIAESGLYQPLLVRPMFNEEDGELEIYEIVAGARRFRAVMELGMSSVPCLSREMSDEEAREAQIVENLQRADVHPVEEAEAYARLIEAAKAWQQVDYGGHVSVPERVGVDLTAEDIAKRVGKATAYVAQRLKLLDLTAESKDLYSAGHVTLGHALLLARLTAADQEKALCFMLDIDRKYVKRPIAEIVGKLLARSAPKVAAEKPTPGVCRFCGCTEEKACLEGCAWIDDEMTICSADACSAKYEEMLDDDLYGEDDSESSGKSTARIQKYMHEGKRTVEATEAQLKRWIESNILLKLADVPWRLDDADLVPSVGACVTCPKRSGSNAALFSDLTVADDVCLDTACFASKQDATLKRHKQAARVAGAKALLKISEKQSREKLAEPAVRRLPLTTPSGGPKHPGTVVGESVYVTKKTVRKGQWIFAEEDSCKDVIRGLMVDGDDKGRIFVVCANQECKVHEHECDRPSSSSGGGRDDFQEQQRKAREKADAYVAAEVPVRKAVYAAIKAKAKPTIDELVRVLVYKVCGRSLAALICEQAGVSHAVSKEEWQTDGFAQEALKLEIAKRSGAALLSLAFDVVHAEKLRVNTHMHQARKRDREDTWKLAAAYGVDADAIAKAAEPKPVKKTAVKPVAKKAAEKAAKKATKKTPAKKAAAKKKASK